LKVRNTQDSKTKNKQTNKTRIFILKLRVIWLESFKLSYNYANIIPMFFLTLSGTFFVGTCFLLSLRNKTPPSDNNKRVRRPYSAEIEHETGCTVKRRTDHCPAGHQCNGWGQCSGQWPSTLYTTSYLPDTSCHQRTQPKEHPVGQRGRPWCDLSTRSLCYY
jgi:hypothetical protein